MPAFQELLTQLSAEYERVESALADAIAELRIGHGRDVRAGSFASGTPPGGRPKVAVGWQDEHAIKEEQGEVCERGRSRSREPTLPTVEHTPTVEPVAEEGIGIAVLPVATADVSSRGASGSTPLELILAASAQMDRGVEQKSPRRHHIARSSSKPSPGPPRAMGFSEDVMGPQSSRESLCTQDTWEAYVSLKETPSPSRRLDVNMQATSPRRAQGVRVWISRACARGVSTERDEPPLIGSGSSSLMSCRSNMKDALPQSGRPGIQIFPPASRWVINPDTNVALEKWDLITMVALTYVALITPLQVSMMEVKLDVMLFVNGVIDFVFFCDMILQFFLMYPEQTNGINFLEYRHPKIIDRYLKTWFAIDILSIIPVDLFVVLSNSAPAQQLKLVKAVRVIRLLKVFRVWRASKLFRRVGTRMSITYGKLSIIKFFVILSVIIHWLANLWALTLVIVDESEGLPRWVDALTELEANVAVKTKDSAAKLYVACLYFTSYTITSVGYGDIVPNNICERVVLTVIVIVSGISWAVILGEVCSIINNLDKDEQAFRSTMDELDAMMQDQLIPGPMRTRLRGFFLSNKTAQKKALHLKILSRMSSGLRGEVSWEINRVWLEKVNFLRPLLREALERQDTEIIRSLRPFVFDLSLMLEHMVCAQGEAFGVLQTLYILNRGLVVRRNRLFRSASVWGSDFVLSDRRLLETADSHALTYIEVTSLSRLHFLDLVQRHSKSFSEIQRTVRRFCCWLAFQRALLIEARRRQGLLRGS